MTDSSSPGMGHLRQGPARVGSGEVVSLLKRWLLGTHHGAVVEFTFRFNRRTSRARGKLFYRLAQSPSSADTSHSGR